MDNPQKLLSYLKLQFNIQYPSFEELYEFGYQCGLNDVPEQENPYEILSLESEHWLEGWWDGFYQRPSQYQATVSDQPINLNQAFINRQSSGLNSYLFEKINSIASLLTSSSLVMGYQLMDLVA